MAARAAGLDITPALAAAGGFGVAAGLGAQSLVRDWIAGFFIIHENQFDVGDVVRVAGVSGTVEMLSLRHTELRDGEGFIHFIPNGEIKVVTNLTKSWATPMVRVPVSVAEDPDRVIGIVEAMLPTFQADPAIRPLLLEGPRLLGIEDVGPGHYTLLLQAKTVPEQRLVVARALRRSLIQRLLAEGSRWRRAWTSRRRPPWFRWTRPSPHRRVPGLRPPRRPRRTSLRGVPVSLRAYDMRRRAKVPFEPVSPGRAGMYVCGMTVQGQPHVGHMRSSWSGDAIRRSSSGQGYEVTYVYNFTDIDDKIIDAGERRGDPVGACRASATSTRSSASPTLHNVKPRDHYPRATEHIPEILDLIARLIEKGHAYAAGGDVYFDVRSYPTVRQALGRQRRRPALGMPDRGGRGEARPARLRAVEGREAGRARVGEPVGTRAGPAGTSSAPRWR